MKAFLFALAILIGAEVASGQTVFFDDFNGNSLLPHWQQPLPNRWQYDVSNGMLNVQRVLYPSNPKLQFNATAMGAVFIAVGGDFQVVSRMGWEANEGGGIEVALNGPAGGSEFIAAFGYAASGLYVRNNNQTLQFAAPPPGNYDFAIDRTASNIRYLLNGQLLATLPDVLFAPVASVRMGFTEPFPIASPGALHIDFVQVIPDPAGFTTYCVLVFSVVARRRR